DGIRFASRIGVEPLRRCCRRRVRRHDLVLCLVLVLGLLFAPLAFDRPGRGADGVEVDAATPCSLAVAGEPFDGAAHTLLVEDGAGALARLLLLVVGGAEPVAVLEAGLPTLRPGRDVVDLPDVGVAVRGAAALVRAAEQGRETAWELPGP